MLSSYSVSGARVVTTNGPLDGVPISVKAEKLIHIGTASERDLRVGPGFTLYPALINVHDHLRGDYLPRIGLPEGMFYSKCADWINDLNASDVIAERGKLTEEECYFLGSYKNLFSGVTTVNDHYPHKLNDGFIPHLPIRVIQDYTLHHEVSSHSLEWGDGIKTENKRARKKNLPFIVHLEEGFNEDYQNGVEVLESLGCLEEHGVFVHCIGFSDEDIEKVARAGATVVWCPASNYFMFNITCKLKKLLERGVNVALGTDSTHTGSINLLEEMRFAQKIYRHLYREDLSGKALFDMVTANPARAFRMEGQIGSITEGKSADLLLLRTGSRKDPYDSLLAGDIEDIALLTLDGMPVYGDRRYKEFFELDDSDFSDILIGGTEKFVKGDPAGLLKTVRAKVGYPKQLDFMPLEGL